MATKVECVTLSLPPPTAIIYRQHRCRGPPIFSAESQGSVLLNTWGCHPRTGIVSPLVKRSPARSLKTNAYQDLAMNSGRASKKQSTRLHFRHTSAHSVIKASPLLSTIANYTTDTRLPQCDVIDNKFCFAQLSYPAPDLTSSILRKKKNIRRESQQNEPHKSNSPKIRSQRACYAELLPQVKS